MFAQYRQNRTPIRNIIHFIHISLRYKTALTTKTVKLTVARLGAPDFGGITRRKQTADWTTPHEPLQITVFARV